MKEKVFKIQNITFLGMLLIVLPFIVATFYALPSADDFYGSSIGKEVTLSSAFSALAESYFNWQGVYFPAFFGSYFAPFHRFGILGNQMFLFISMILFLVSYYKLIKVILAELFSIKQYNMLYIIMGISLFIILNIRTMNENFYWQVTGFLYTIPIAMAFFALSNMVTFLNKKATVMQTVYNAIIVFLAAGGVLQVPALMCWTLLCLLIYSVVTNNKSKMSFIILFVVSLAGALINALAPGNFVRASAYDETGLHFIKAIINMLIVTLREIYILNVASYLPFLLIIVFVLGVKCLPRRKISFWNNPISIAFACGMLACIVVFPVVLARSRANMEHRTYFLLDIIIIIMEVVLVLSITNVVKSKWEINFQVEQNFIIAIVFFLGFISFNASNSITDGIWFNSTKSVLNGDLQAYSNEWQEILQYLESSEEDIVQLDELETAEQTMIKEPRITNDKDDWVNKVVATYYQKDAIYFVE